MKSLSILFIDDDEIERLKFKKVCESFNKDISILEADNGKNALVLLSNKTTTFDLIVSDLNMPVMDGFRFVELFTKTEEFKKYKPQIVVLSTSLIPEEKEKIKANKNIIKFLNKPLTKEILSDFLLTNF